MCCQDRSVPNVWAEEWDWESAGPDAPTGYDLKAKRLVGGGRLGLSLYEIPAGATQAPYHFHHGGEELLVVLRGRPTLRTPDGERELAEGDAVHFVKGPAGAHQLSNDAAEPVRYAIFGTLTSPEVVEYPDSGKAVATARTDSQRGERLWTVHRLDEGVEYFTDEPDR